MHQQILIAESAYTPPPAGSGWDPSLKGTSVTLSNGDLDAAKAGAGYETVYGTQGRSSGRYAFEIVTTVLPSLSTLLVGVADKTNTAGMLITFIGNNSGPVEAIGWNNHTTSRYYKRMTVGNANGTTMSLSAYNLGDVVTFDVDMDANTLSFYKNGSLVTPSGIAITPGKTYFPAASIQSGAAVRIRSTGLSYPPSGATAWG